jgi:hypothetical protein
MPIQLKPTCLVEKVKVNKENCCASLTSKNSNLTHIGYYKVLEPVIIIMNFGSNVLKQIVK